MTDDRPNKAIHDFTDLMVYQKAYACSLEVHGLSLQLPRTEQYGLAEQLRRSSKGICANIAEGFGKQNVSTAEFKRFLLMAMGSADEMRVWLSYCADLGYAERAQCVRWVDEYRGIARMLNGLHSKWG
jgi:four helix bundle protein